jgi:periplasmic divalent cation tolerance protein
MKENGLAQVTTALPTREAAEAMAARVIDSGLAACAQVSGPVISHFIWKGERCREEEWLCVMKTPASQALRLMEHVRVSHPYETPEVIVTPVTHVLPSYLKWAEESVRDPE